MKKEHAQGVAILNRYLNPCYRADMVIRTLMILE